MRPYIERADELRRVSPLVAYNLRVMAATIGLARASGSAEKQYLCVLMDTLEEERKLLAPTTQASLDAMRSLALDLSGALVPPIALMSFRRRRSAGPSARRRAWLARCTPARSCSTR